MKAEKFKYGKILRGCVMLMSVASVFIVTQPQVAAQTSQSIETLRATGKAFAEIASKASPAVVGIRVESKAEGYEYPSTPQFPSGPFGQDFFDYFFHHRFPRQQSPRERYRQISQGSGFIVSSDGYILTNGHLVDKAEKVVVKLSDGTQTEAKVVGSDPESDVAVVKVNVKGQLPVLQLGDSDALEVGEWVLAIGNPFGLSHTITAGIVSAKGRSGMGISTYEDFIQTDAAINPGNSGGPLINMDAQVIGINTAIVGSSGNIGIGLVIPINMAKSVYQQLIKGGKVVRGFMGVAIQDLTSELAASLDLKVDTKGVVVSDVINGSSAQKAGLKRGDVIIELDGRPVQKADELRYRIAMLKPETEVKVTVLRGRTQETFTVILGQMPKQAVAADTQPQVLEQLGLTVKDLTDEWARHLGYEGLTGVVVTDVEDGSLVALAGIEAGNLIQEVNRKPIKNAKEFYEALKKASAKGGAVLLLVNDGHTTEYIVLSLAK